MTVGWGLLGLCVFCALWDLGARSLHVHDTARWGLLAREMIDGGQWLVPHRYGELYVNKPPLYLWAVAGPSALFGGVTPLWVRLPSAVGFLMMLWATYAWSRDRLGRVTDARLATLLVLTTPACFWLAREGRLDMFASGLAVCAAWQADRLASQRGSGLTPWLLGLLLGAAMLTKGPPLLLAPLLAWALPRRGMRLRDRLAAGKPWIVAPVMAAVALAWFVPAVQAAGWEAYGKRLLVDQAADRVAGVSTHTHGPFWYLGAIPLHMALHGALYLVLGVLALRRGWIPKRVRPLALAWCIGVVAFSLVPTKHVRYLPPLVPFAAMALACTLRVRWRAQMESLAVGRLGSGLLAMAGAGLVVAGCLTGIEGAVAVGVPALGAFIVGIADMERREPRRRTDAVPVVLAAMALLLVAGFALRDRMRVPSKEAFVRELAAELRPGDRVVTTHHATPEGVFHLPIRPHHHPDPSTVDWTAPGGRWLVIADQDRVAEVEALAGRRAVVVARHPKSRDVGLVLPAR